MESKEELKAENERLLAEIASMKKKVKLALKKQQADLQSRIQAAEQRAVAAEAATASDANGALSRSDSEIVATHSSASEGNGSMSLSSSPSHPLSLASSNGAITHHISLPSNGDTIPLEASAETLLAELKLDGQNSFGNYHEVLKERQRLENEVMELRKEKVTAVKASEEARGKFEAELCHIKGEAEQRVELLTKANENLEAQLVGAADQIAEAFSRISVTHDDMERISRENQETRRAHATLATEYESVVQNLNLSRDFLAEAQQKVQEKEKEIEELVATRKSAQEGQEAAMSKLMHELDEMGGAGPSLQSEHLREVLEKKVQVLVLEKADLQKNLDISGDAINLLREEITSYQQRLQIVEATAPKSNSREILDVENTGFGLKANNESLLDELGFQFAEVKRLQEELKVLRDTDRQEAPSTLQELSTLKAQLESMEASQLAAENQIKRLSVVCNDREVLVEKLSLELANARSTFDDERKVHDIKYADLDAKFGRLQKRAKQRIQEVQKDKDEAEIKLAAAGEKAAQALSKQAALQDDLERVRLQTAEALRALDVERQQLRVANIKLRGEVEDLSRTLQGKEHNLAESRRLASEKDQAALELAAMLKETEEKCEAAIADLKDKHQKAEESLSAQVADATLENSKMSETITALQADLSIKESKFAELDAASSGEMARVGASLEASKREVSRLESDHKRELESSQATTDKLRRKLLDSEKVIAQKEFALAELRSQMESELERQRQILGIAQEDLSGARNETARITSELAAYKVRAYALLQKKEAEILAAKDSDLAAAQETALKEAKREAVLAAVDRDRALKSLQDAILDYENKISARDISVLDAEQRIRDLATKLEASKGQLLAEQDEWQQRLAQMESTWRSKHDSLEAKVAAGVEADLKHEYTALMSDYNNLKREFDSFRDLVDTMIEEKDKEISRLLEDNANLQRPPLTNSLVRSEDPTDHAPDQQDPDSTLIAIAEQQILVLARQQAQREEEVSQCRRHIQALQEEITDLEQENRLHNQQEALLKEELRSLERSHKRDGVDMTYVKNVILKLLETGEVEALLPVVAMLLQFSPDELKRCTDTYSTAANMPVSGATGVADSAVSTPRTFLSRLSFTG